MELNKIINGDCLEVLKTIPDKFVNCCVTSPPYWGLRDYGVDGQLGLEPTPEEYIEKMVNVFREVRRVLKDDGTLWLNIGDSYAHPNTGGNGATGGRDKSTLQSKMPPKGTTPVKKHMPVNLKPKDLVGIPWMLAFALRQPYETHLIKDITDRAYLGGLIDGEGCITILKTKSSHCESFSYPPIVQIRMCDTGAIDYFSDLIKVNRSGPELYNSQKNNNQRESYNVKATSKKALELIADIYPFLRVKQKQAIIAYNHQLSRNKTNYQPRSKEQIEKEKYCKKLINDLNQNKSRDIPSWMIEPQFNIEKGWYLRQDLIWHKPNPMPESVTDRCTKSHEYIFLLSKSQKYYYDAEAIKEETTGNAHDRGHGRNPKTQNKVNGWACGKGISHDTISHQTPAGKIKSKQNESFCSAVTKVVEKRNKRSVWTVPTQPFKKAHFAKFPEKLIEPCILAGCPKDGIVLDPFIGSGTTGKVSRKYHRNFIGIDINSTYILEIAEDRTGTVQPVLEIML